MTVKKAKAVIENLDELSEEDINTILEWSGYYLYTRVELEVDINEYNGDLQGLIDTIKNAVIAYSPHDPGDIDLGDIFIYNHKGYYDSYPYSEIIYLDPLSLEEKKSLLLGEANNIIAKKAKSCDLKS